MLHTPKKAAATQNNVARPQKAAATTHQCLAAAKKNATTKDRCRVPQKRTAATQNNVARPKRPYRRNTNVARPQKKGHDDEAGTPRLRKGPRQRFAGDESPTRAASKPCCNKPKSYFKYFSEIVIRFITQSGKKTAFPGSTKLLN